jgi:hypothetical protein
MPAARDMVSCGNNSRLGADPRLLLGCSGYCAGAENTFLSGWRGARRVAYSPFWKVCLGVPAECPERVDCGPSFSCRNRPQWVDSRPSPIPAANRQFAALPDSHGPPTETQEPSGSHVDRRTMPSRNTVLARRSETYRLIAYLGYSGPTQTVGAAANPIPLRQNVMVMIR